MQQAIHPKYKEITVKCNCGTSFKTYSTKCSDLSLDICSSCHPFYTGQQKLIDTEGRVDNFKRKFATFGKPQPAATPAPEAKSEAASDDKKST